MKLNHLKELSLGKKIKMLRIERKITQQELVGDFITRNMLSQIENDIAFPSMKTLNFLSDALGVPLSYLMQTENDVSYGVEFETVDGIDLRAKKMFLSGDYMGYIDTAEKNPEILEEYKEERLFLGLAYLEYAEKLFEAGNLKECLEYCEKALNIDFEECKFAEEEIRKHAKLYKLLCSPEHIDSYDFLRQVLDQTSLCRYNLISAKQALNQKSYEQAIKCLKEAEHLIENTAMHPYLSEIYKAFEAGYVALEDYKNAHLYSSKLLNLYADK
ncbi:MAG: helix-turn-helix domain-containing protein [Oscillospiraceae bacterium]|nr:helix-turn-helix domain-containing protein [Oscillospiraceae bacterium]